MPGLRRLLDPGPDEEVLPSLGIPREKMVFVSGIGCSSRFPYYMNTYGMHGIHGRAPAIATGLKAVRPDLQVWVITGDGDGLSIGGQPPDALHPPQHGHQYHPLQQPDLRPDQGPVLADVPAGPGHQEFAHGRHRQPAASDLVAIGCEATFVARTIDVHIKHLGMVLERAADHRGTAFIEVYQNCVVFNDGAFDYATDRDIEGRQRARTGAWQAADLRQEPRQRHPAQRAGPGGRDLGNGISEDDLLFHDEKAAEPSLAYSLSRLRHEDGFPEPIGVFRAVEAPRYDDELNRQIDFARRNGGRGDLNTLFNSGETWTVS